MAKSAGNQVKLAKAQSDGAGRQARLVNSKGRMGRKRRAIIQGRLSGGGSVGQLSQQGYIRTHTQDAIASEPAGSPGKRRRKKSKVGVCMYV